MKLVALTFIVLLGSSCGKKDETATNSSENLSADKVTDLQREATEQATKLKEAASAKALAAGAAAKEAAVEKAGEAVETAGEKTEEAKDMANAVKDLAVDKMDEVTAAAKRKAALEVLKKSNELRATGTAEP